MMDKTPSGFAKNPKLHAMELQLSELAAKWRRTKSDKLAGEYRQVLRQMLELGWEGQLDVDSELPEKEMPEEYLKRFTIKNGSSR